MSFFSRTLFSLTILLASGCAVESGDSAETSGAVRQRTLREVNGDVCVARSFAVNDPDDADNAEQSRGATGFTGDDSNPAVNAYWMAVASALVYSSKDHVTSDLKSYWRASEVRWIEKRASMGNSQAVFAQFSRGQSVGGNGAGEAGERNRPTERRIEEFSILAFRGTESRGDVISDISSAFIEGKAPDGQGDYALHKGFSEAFDEINLDVLAVARRSKGPIFLTGHSLGGALATIAAFVIMSVNDPSIKLGGLYTFGSPRVGDARFARLFNAMSEKRDVNLRRYVNNNDVVTMVPDRAVAALSGKVSQVFAEGWRHVGRGGSARDSVVWFMQNGKRFSLAEALERSGSTVWSSRPGIDWVTDHKISRYVWMTEMDAFGSRTLCPGH
jgi:hypothetical protein